MYGAGEEGGVDLPWVCHPSSISMCSATWKFSEPHRLGGNYEGFLMKTQLNKSLAIDN